MWGFGGERFGRGGVERKGIGGCSEGYGDPELV